MTQNFARKTRLITVIAMLLIAIGSTTACGTPAGSAAASSSGSNMPVTDWDNLKPVESPNKWLVAPADAGLSNADQVAPEWQVGCTVLAGNWKAVLESQPRTEILAVSPDGLQIEAQQKSAVFGFVDRISSRAIPRGDHVCALAIYSRSTVGYWDLGVNRRRVQGWLEDLDKRIAADDLHRK